MSEKITREALHRRVACLASDSARDIWLSSQSVGSKRLYRVEERDGAGWRKISPTLNAREMAAWCHGFERALLGAHVPSAT